MSKVADKIAGKIREANGVEPKIKEIQEAISRLQNDLQVLVNRRNNLVQQSVGLGELLGYENVDQLAEAIQRNDHHLADKIKEDPDASKVSTPTEVRGDVPEQEGAFQAQAVG